MSNLTKLALATMLGVISCLMLMEFTQVHCNSAFSNQRLVTTLCFCTAAVNEPCKARWLLYVPSALTLKSSVSPTDCIYMFLCDSEYT